MSPASPRKKNGCSTQRRRSRASWCVLAWIFLSQFPLPFAHTHASEASGNLELAAHLVMHHPACQDTGWQDADCDPTDCDPTKHLHWHLVFPWQGGDESSDEHHQSSPLGIWGSSQSCVSSGNTGSAPREIQTELPTVMSLGSIISSRDLMARALYQSSSGSTEFLATYAGVRPCALLCIARS